MSAEPRDDGRGDGIIRASWRSTVGLIALLAVGVSAPDAAGPAVAAVAAVMFFSGTGLMAYAYLLGIRRSRAEQITVPGLFLLQGSAPATVRRQLLWSFALQCLAGIAAASLRLYTLIAFGVLAPTFGLGLGALWAARYGRFEPREPLS